jgi:hypothetical protein
MQKLQTYAANEQGMQLLEWVGISALVLILIGGIWSAFYGMPGQALKEVMQVQVFRYADGFEGGLYTTGPSGAAPTMGQSAQPRGGTRLPGSSIQPPAPNSAAPAPLVGPMLGVPKLIP